MESLLSGLVGAFIGAALGFGGAFALEARRDTRHSRIVLSSVTLELALLSAALKELAINRRDTRRTLDTPYWDRHGPDLVNCLPPRLLKALYLLYLDEFEQVKKGHELVREGRVSEAIWPEIGATLLGWAFKAERMLQLISEERKGTGLFARWTLRGNSNQDFMDVEKDLMSYAETCITKYGFPTDTILSISHRDDGSMEAQRTKSEGATPSEQQVTPS